MEHPPGPPTVSPTCRCLKATPPRGVGGVVVVFILGSGRESEH